MDGKKVKETTVVISHVMMPNDANPSGNVHGGTIMKLIDQIATVVAMRHARCIAVTASIDRIDFHYPVFVGNLLTLKANINMVGNTSHQYALVNAPCIRARIRRELSHLFFAETHIEGLSSVYFSNKFLANKRNNHYSELLSLNSLVLIH